MIPQRPELRVGAQVRLVSHRYLGQIGVVRALPKAPQRVGSGVMTQAVQVLCDGEDQSPIWFPQSAVEVIS